LARGSRTCYKAADMPSPGTLGAKVSTSADVAPVPLLYRTLRGPVRALLDGLFDFAVEGLEHLPRGGPYIVAANHHNYLDAIVLAVAVPPPISFIVMPRVWRATPLHPLFHRHVRSIRINLERPDVAALRCALAALASGGVVGIFPEGPFSIRGRLERGLHGVALLALRSGVPVIPAGIRGTYEALTGRWGYIPRRHPVHVAFGPARVFTGDASGARRARAAVTTRIMSDIAGLLE
jgi:1-acyl-sn-glycerol-3-phosphate acyltransferase